MTLHKIMLPQVLAEMTGGQRLFSAQGKTPLDVLHNLAEQRPGLRTHFFDDTGNIRRHIICIVEEDYLRAADLSDYTLPGQSEIRLINALAGG